MLEPLDAASFGREHAVHLLSRAGFGGTRGEIDAVVALGLDAAVDRLMDFPDAPPSEVDDGPDLSVLEGIPKTRTEQRQMVRQLETEAERDALQAKIRQANREVVQRSIDWWWDRMARGVAPLQDKLSLLWHGHFTTSARDIRQEARLVWPQHETLRTHLAGNFGDFCKAIARDPAMILYLNNQQNRVGAPNENFARELMELFMLGIGNYSENDIKQAARAFTGWHTDGESFTLRQLQHDDGTKTVFGYSGNFDGDDIVDLILRHPACSKYVCRELLAYFVTSEPDEAVVESLAAVLVEHGYDLRPVYDVMFRSAYFFDPAHIGNRIKSPVELLVGLVHQTGFEAPPARQLIRHFQKMGQVLFNPPTVKGWPSGREWINTATLFARNNACIDLAAQRGYRYLHEDETSEQFVARWVDALYPNGLPSSRTAPIVESVGVAPTDASARAALQLIVTLPEYQLG
ncbi:MAG: DUF1800 domain-containing protein [Planctomycetota bacterium]